MDPSFKFPIIPEALACVISLNAKGEPATLGDWMDQEAPLSVKQDFNRTAAKPAVAVLHVDALDFAQQKKLALAAYANTDGKALRAVPGTGTFTAAQQLDEIWRETAVGKRIISELVDAGRTKQDAVKSGQVVRLSLQDALNAPRHTDPF